jgi:hypothetical protein
MTRVVTVLLLAFVMAEVSGINDVSLALEGQSTTKEAKRRADVVTRLAKIPVKSVVKVETTDGTKLDALLEEVTPDTISVSVLAKKNTAVEKRTIVIDDIKKIEKVQGVGVRVLKVVGVTTLVLVGLCAVAVTSADVSSPSPEPKVDSGPPAFDAASRPD